jgi:endoglycosylceramidase
MPTPRSALRPTLFASFCLLAASCDATPAPAPTPTVPDATRWITDDGHRVLVLRGVNASGSAKNDPLRSPNLSDADIERIAHHYGFDFARYLVLWDALEPQPGQIDAKYVERIAADVARLGEAGVRVMLDMHQDVYAQRFCCDGAPDWAIRDDGQPFVLQTNWAFNYVEPAVIHAFDNFFAPTGPDTDLQDHYAAAWKALAQRFAGDPNVIGYDLMNEPFAGSYFDVVEAIARSTPADGGTSKTFDQTLLGPFYQKMTDAIRTVDADHWIFFEPRYGAPANGSPSFLPTLHDPRPGSPRVVLAPHLYSAAAEATGAFDATDATVSRWEQERTKERALQKGPLLLGEFWDFRWAAPNAAAFTESVLDMADRMEIGWAYWSYGAGAPDGNALFAADGSDNPVVGLVVRPYPRAIAGEPVRWSYDPASRVLDLAFDERSAVIGPTEIFVPEALVYPDGWTLAVDSDPPKAWTSSFDPATGIVSVSVDRKTTHHHLRITPKAPGG